jgi:hypothetical protein
MENLRAGPSSGPLADETSRDCASLGDSCQRSRRSPGRFLPDWLLAHHDVLPSASLHRRTVRSDCIDQRPWWMMMCRGFADDLPMLRNLWRTGEVPAVLLVTR